MTHSEKFPKYWQTASLIVLCIVTIMAVRMHLSVIQIPTPTEIREGAALDAVQCVKTGKNPYADENLPQHLNVYGFVYPSIVAAVPSWMGEGLPAARGVTAAALLIACGLLFQIARKTGLETPAAASAAALFYTLVATTYSLIARPDTLGIMLMLLTIRLAMSKNPWLHVLSAAAGVAAFLTKPYFVFGIGAGGAWLLWNSGLRPAAKYGLFVIATFTVALIAIPPIFPNYWPLVAIHKTERLLQFNRLSSQLRYFGILQAPFICVGILITTLTLFKLWKQKQMTAIAPTIGWALTCVTAASAILLSVLGWHKGAYLIYFVHLLSPYLLLLVFLGWKNNRALPHAVIVQSIILGCSLPPAAKTQDIQQAWKPLTALKANGLQKGPVLGSILLQGWPGNNGIDMPDNGQSEYLIGFNTKTGEEIGHTKKFVADIKTKIETGYYAEIWRINLIDWPYIPKELLEKHYRPVGRLHLPVFYCLYTQPNNYGRKNAACPLDCWIRK